MDMISTVRFGDYDSWLDFGLIRTATTIAAPEIKAMTVDVPGMDGTLDLSEYFGEIVYQDRELSFDFETKTPMSLFPRLYAKVCNAIDGKRCHVTLSEDPGFYWVGRVSVDDWKSSGRIGKISVSATCEPYRYKSEVTRVTFALNGSPQTFILRNLRKRVVPKFTFAGDTKVTFGGFTASASAGEWSNDSVALLQGENTITLEGTGSVVIEYQERGL